jgi:hypothetical protein
VQRPWVGRARRPSLHPTVGHARGGRPRVWTEERILDELTRFVEGQRFFPTEAEFRAAGLASLRYAVTNYRGVPYWAARVGLPLRPTQKRSHYTLDAALAEAREVIAELGHLPGANKLRQLDRPGLATFVARNGGSSGFRRRFGL